jgi:hypothetical protein
VTYPRAHLIDRENGGFYHLISRCVRRAWRCGEDPLTGCSFEHRRQWIEERMLQLATFFLLRFACWHLAIQFKRVRVFWVERLRLWKWYARRDLCLSGFIGPDNDLKVKLIENWHSG